MVRVAAILTALIPAVFLVLQFTGGIAQVERSWPVVMCRDLTPSFFVHADACAYNDGVAIWLRFLPAGGGEGLLPERGAVFSREKANSLLDQCSRDTPAKPSDTWLPTPGHIRKLEAKLNPALSYILPYLQTWERPPAPRDYYRQYGGFIVSGKRFIYINGFHERVLELLKSIDTGEPKTLTEEEYWHKDPMTACDGGSWYFGATYDVEADEIGSVQFNP